MVGRWQGVSVCVCEGDTWTQPRQPAFTWLPCAIRVLMLHPMAASWWWALLVAGFFLGVCVCVSSKCVISCTPNPRFGCPSPPPVHTTPPPR